MKIKPTSENPITKATTCYGLNIGWNASYLSGSLAEVGLESSRWSAVGRESSRWGAVGLESSRWSAVTGPPQL